MANNSWRFQETYHTLNLSDGNLAVLALRGTGIDLSSYLLIHSGIETVSNLHRDNLGNALSSKDPEMILNYETELIEAQGLPSRAFATLRNSLDVIAKQEYELVKVVPIDFLK